MSLWKQTISSSVRLWRASAPTLTTKEKATYQSVYERQENLPQASPDQSNEPLFRVSFGRSPRTRIRWHKRVSSDQCSEKWIVWTLEDGLINLISEMVGLINPVAKGVRINWITIRLNYVTKLVGPCTSGIIPWRCQELKHSRISRDYAFNRFLRSVRVSFTVHN